MENEVMFKHVRGKNPDGTISNMGGMTLAYTFLQGGYVKFAVAVCHPNDNFEKRIGRVKSAGRLRSANYAIIRKFEPRDDLNKFLRAFNYEYLEELRGTFGFPN
jgi:hypothetical protein